MLLTSAVVALLLAVSTLAEDPLVVDTAGGKLRGYRLTSRGGRQFLAFSGVPYAQPPLGPLRFQPPVEAEGWEGVRNATEPGPWCVQYNTYEINPKPFGTEDCLYLSVYTHQTNERRAVMVHYHGGGFMSGNGPRKTMPQYLMDKDVVIVDVNYRVGFLGFLSFEDEEMPGNQGLKDQVMALRWVKKNIAKFGGDPDKVTIVGESAGAGSVYHHTVSPLSKGLFRGVIAESGTSYDPWAVAPPGFARSMAKQLSEFLGCPDSNYTRSAVSCLRSKNASDVAAGLESFRVWQIDTGVIWPCLEPEGPGAFLTGPVSRWQHQPVPMMLGTTSGEGLLRTGYFIYYKMDFKWFNNNFDNVGPLSLKYSTMSSDPKEVSDKLRQYYFPPAGEITSDSWNNLTQLFTDSWFTIGIIDGANYHTGDAYFYYFDYIGEYTFRPETNRTLFYGAPHTEEANFLWKNPNFPDRMLKGGDLELSKKLVQIWTDFAIAGTPAPEGSDISWTKWNPKRHNYLSLSESGFEEKEGFAMDRYQFWKTLNYRDNIK